MWSFQQGQSTTHVNNPSLETHGKTKLHVAMSTVKKREKWEAEKVKYTGWEPGLKNQHVMNQH